MHAFLHSFVYAFHGIAYIFRTQRNAKVHVAVACGVVLAALLVRLSAVEWAILAMTIGMVFSAEVTNTVIELAVDLLIQRRDPRAKIAKDAGAGAVLITAIAAVGVGLALFGPRLLRMVLAK